jgi:hypothetical protein
MDPDYEEARDQPDDPKNRLAKRRSREKRKHDQVRNEGNAGEVRSKPWPLMCLPCHKMASHINSLVWKGRHIKFYQAHTKTPSAHKIHIKPHIKAALASHIKHQTPVATGGGRGRRGVCRGVRSANQLKVTR